MAERTCEMTLPGTLFHSVCYLNYACFVHGQIVNCALYSVQMN